MPPLPFRNNALRKASDEPFFDTGEYEDEDEDDEPTGDMIVKALIAQNLLTREQLEKIGPQGVLVGLH